MAPRREQPPEEPPPWGRFIKERREARGLTIRQAALLADISDSYWSQVERGHQTSRGHTRQIHPSRPMLITLAETLRLSTRETNRLLTMADLPHVQESTPGGADRSAMVNLTSLSRRDVALLNAIADRLREAVVPAIPAPTQLRRVSRKPDTPKQRDADGT